jgi:hypothetical protein
VAFKTGSQVEQMRITTGGDIGIGTSTPGALLHVSNGSAKVRIGLTASNQYADIYRDSATGYTIYNAAQSSPYTGHIWQVASTEYMRISSAGLVGIGVSTPTAPLQLYAGGAPAASGNMTTGAVVGAGAGSFALNIGSDQTAGYNWINSAYINGSNTASPLVFMGGTTERMRITAAGLVGIGTSSPTACLHVPGTSTTIAALLTNIAEPATISATAATGTIAFYPSTQSVLYYTSNASANWTTNITFSSGTTMNTAMTTGQSITVAFLVTQGTTA